MKKLISVTLSIALLFTLVLSLGGCGSKGVTVGIVQIVEHPSLNTIRESIVKELEVLGYKDGENIRIDYQNAQNDRINLTTICQKFVNNRYDIIIAIATPSAQQALNETRDIPIIFSACTDPIGTGLIDSIEKPGGNITGTSDAVSAEMIMSLAQDLTPGIKTVGALYNLSEPNSVSVIEDLKEYAEKSGTIVKEATVVTSADVQQAVNSLVGKVDAIFSPIDNTVASAMAVVAQAAIDAKIPVYVGADSMVKDGGFATYGINYEILGKETARMAAEVLKGKKPGDIPIRLMTDMDIYINSDTAEAIGVEIPAEILQNATVFSEK